MLVGQHEQFAHFDLASGSCEGQFSQLSDILKAKCLIKKLIDGLMDNENNR